MKRRPLKLGVFLLLGAIVNVAVAWGCAIPDQRYAFLAHGVGLTKPEAVAAWNRLAYRYIGSFDDVVCIRARTLAFEGFLLIARDPAIASCNNGQFASERTWHFRQLRFGFPTPALGLELSHSEECGSGTNLRTYCCLGSDHPIPTRLLWPGFAINTIFYGGILWLLWITPGKVRRFVRVRRYRCPACGFIIAPGTCANGLCSECGATLPWMRKSPT